MGQIHQSRRPPAELPEDCAPSWPFLVGHYERAGALARYCRRPLTALRLDRADGDDPIELDWFRWHWERAGSSQMPS